MHIIDTLETSQNFPITASTSASAADNEEVGELHLPHDQYYFSAQTPIANILDTGLDCSVILNSLNRSMGLDDAFPIVLTQCTHTHKIVIYSSCHS